MTEFFLIATLLIPFFNAYFLNKHIHAATTANALILVVAVGIFFSGFDGPKIYLNKPLFESFINGFSVFYAILLFMLVFFIHIVQVLRAKPIEITEDKLQEN